MAGEDVVQTIQFNIIISAKGAGDVRKTKEELTGLTAAQRAHTEAQGNAIRSGIKMVNHLNRLQNVVFRAAVLTGLFGNTNTALAKTLRGVAIALDVAFAAARAFLIISDAATQAAKKEGASHLIKWIAASGPVGAPMTAAVILATIAGAATLFFALSAKSAAFGGVFDRPTHVIAGDSPRGPELIAPVQDILNRGGGGNVQVFIDGKHIEDVLSRRETLNGLRGLGNG